MTTTITITTRPGDSSKDIEYSFWSACDSYFRSHSEPEAALPAGSPSIPVTLSFTCCDETAIKLYNRGLFTRESKQGNTIYTITRDIFYQWNSPEPSHTWHLLPQPPAPPSYVTTNTFRHPRRNPKPPPGAEIYIREIPSLSSTFTLRVVDPNSTTHLDAFHEWQNNPRVDYFWGEKGSIEAHKTYLENVTKDPHTLSLIGYFDGEPFAYFETYWVAEDRLAPFVAPAALPYDRGLHLLVGNEKFRGPHRVKAWLWSILHFLFLDDVRTERILMEPRADNEKLLGYLQGEGFAKKGCFNFPHKQFALMELSREEFFRKPMRN
ncbi:hypothetical protein YB2330_001018 [Saitoella coloradoensis]